MRRCPSLLLLALVGCATEGTDDPIPMPPATVANGTVTAWQSLAALPVARANHCSATVGNWLLVIGGNRKAGDSFVKTADIHAAQLSADGTLGPWQLAGQAPSPVTECNAAGTAHELVIADGLFDNAAHGRKVWRATLDDTGHLAAWTELGALPGAEIAISSEAYVAGDELVLMDTRLPNEGDTTVTLRTPLTSPLAWTTEDWKIGFRAQAQYAFAEDFTFVLGGYKTGDGNPVTAETFVSTPGGAPRATTPLPAPTSFGEAIAVDDWVFVIGGREQVFGAAGVAAVYAAQIAADGTLGAWAPIAALPMIRTNHDLALVGDYLVLTGGAGMGPGDTTVLGARVRF